MPRHEPHIGRATSNRNVDQASLVSRATVKADAAFRLSRWSAKHHLGRARFRDRPSHPAFQTTDPVTGATKSRVVASYEFGDLRDLLNAAMRTGGDNPVLKDF